jgi:hypothetical protein
MDTTQAPTVDVEAPAGDVAPSLLPFLILAAVALLALYLAKRQVDRLAAAGEPGGGRCACGGALDVDGYCHACGALDGGGPAAPPAGVDVVEAPPAGTGAHLAGHDALGGNVVSLDAPPAAAA